MTDASATAAPAGPRPRRPARRTLAASVLVLEAFLVFFAALVAYGLRLADPAAVWATAGGLILATVLAAGLLRRGVGYVVGSAVQVWLVALGVVMPAMFVLGGIFALLWVVALRLGGRIDRERTERDAAAG